MTKPNFFIIGAPKCGTTSLAVWLAAHPNVFVSPVKEPHHFNIDFGNNYVRSSHQYERLFSAANRNHVAVGEGSVWYLYSEKAVPRILEYNPYAQFIVLLRNPVDMACSLHEQQVFAGNESETSFERAWTIQKERFTGLAIPRLCPDRRLLLYGSACQLGQQLERLYENVSKKKVLTLVLDDIQENPRREYLRVLRFLGVPDDGRKDFRVENSAKVRHSLLAHKAIKLMNGVRRGFRMPRLGTGVMGRLDRLNRRSRSRDPLTPEMRLHLLAYFEKDVETLGQLLGRDLSGWLKVN